MSATTVNLSIFVAVGVCFLPLSTIFDYWFNLPHRPS